ncbi:hypothetical protein [Neorhizobium galegae]|uniref:hypothetical protein n=1 Tax=Neorhizobium galegae TaxID=399 RepID=UPI000622A94E|nr:hypothetical protein [Neorhizobium galegae]CDZ55227.1 Hypothetical protein NGAL_HAMBI2427_61180 [Neorhizobium galegae bv. orientalis]
MDPGIIKRVQESSSASRQAIADCLVETIVDASGDPLTVRKARDELSAVLRRARSGVPQVIGNLKKPDDLAVVISVKDLAELVTAARHQETFGEALDAIGFKPYTGGRIIVSQGNKRERLQRS